MWIHLCVKQNTAQLCNARTMPFPQSFKVFKTAVSRLIVYSSTPLPLESLPLKTHCLFLEVYHQIMHAFYCTADIKSLPPTDRDMEVHVFQTLFTV